MSDFDAIDDALNVESSIVETEKPSPIKRPAESNDIKKDYDTLQTSRPLIGEALQ